MAEEQDKQQKTEEATPQRMREAREKGQVGMSTEAISASSVSATKELPRSRPAPSGSSQGDPPRA